ncbi:hypothetical protein [Mucilaginibacter sp. CSA2-8R]|uniref:hypothetical protein n=1 Tax=Mucilaginibacter sp. CSA2-8R TaxID=3141542 RepID=UPI00315CEA10
MNKFKSPPACFFSHKAIALQSRAAPQAVYILRLCTLWPWLQRKLKGLSPRTGPTCAARLSPEAGEDDGEIGKS